jgi:hypothetical protein
MTSISDQNRARTPQRFQSAAVMVAALAGLAGSVSAQTVDTSWATGVLGTWSNASRWTGGAVPDNGSPPGVLYNVTIDVNPVLPGGQYTVQLDIDAEIEAFTLDNIAATLNLGTRTLTANAAVNLTSGRIRGTSSGRFLARGPTTISGVSIEGPITFESTGDLTLAGATFAGEVDNRTSLTTNGPQTLLAGTTFINTVWTNFSSLTNLTGINDYDICDSDIDHRNGRFDWSGGAALALDGDSSITVRDGALFEVTGAADRAIRGDGTQTLSLGGGAGNGVFRQSGGGTTSFEGVQLENNGLVDVAAGTLTTDTAPVTAGELSSGAWMIRGGAELDFQGAAVNALSGSAEVMLDGAGSVFDAVTTLAAVSDDASFGVTAGRDFATAGGLNINGAGGLLVGSGSELTVSGNLSSIAGGTLTNGRLRLGGTLRADNANITTIAGDLELSGSARFVRPAGGGGDVDALDGLQTITSTGRLSLLGGARLDNIDALDLDGELRLGGTGTPGEAAARVLTSTAIDDAGVLTTVIGSTDDFGSLRVDGVLELGDTGGVTPAGTIRVELDGYTLSIGDRFTVVTAGELIGEFAAIDGPAAGGLFFDVLYETTLAGDDAVTLVVVPSPAGVGLLLLAGARRRRRG